jgi:hypothetical protein
MSSPTPPAFIHYPAQAAFGRVVPKNKIYEHGRVGARLKEKFVQQVEQIVWQYKLAPETINLPARPGVAEIQVFTLQLKVPELGHDVVSCIDQAVQFPIVFELVCGGRARVVACYKRPSETDASRWVLSDYFESDWCPVDIDRVAMPLALDLATLYEQLLHRLMPLPPRAQESLSDLVGRIDQMQAKRRELDRAVTLLERERQFNRKVEVNATVRRLKSELEILTR